MEFLGPSEENTSRIVFTLKGLDTDKSSGYSIKDPPVYEVYRMSMEHRDVGPFGKVKVQWIRNMQAFSSENPSETHMYDVSAEDVVAAFYFTVTHPWRLIDFYEALLGKFNGNGRSYTMRSEMDLSLLLFDPRHGSDHRTSRDFL